MSRSEEVETAVGEVPTEEHETEITQLETELRAPTEREIKAQRLAELKKQRAVKRVAQLTAVGEKRIVAIKRANGSLADQQAQDGHRVLEAAKKFVEALVTLDNRVLKQAMGVREAQWIAGGFGLPDPELQMPDVPSRSGAMFEAITMVNVAMVNLNGNLSGDVQTTPGYNLVEELQKARAEITAQEPGMTEAEVKAKARTSEVLREQRRTGMLGGA